VRSKYTVTGCQGTMPPYSGCPSLYKSMLTDISVEHVIYEKNEDIGGTWLENRYPGAACDVPSHAYTFNFALK
jgi:hypothetical protein